MAVLPLCSVQTAIWISLHSVNKGKYGQSAMTYLISSYLRFGMFGVMEFCRIAGLLLGPTLNIFIGSWSFNFYLLHCNRNNLPGVVLGCCWSLVQCFTICVASNLTLDHTP